MLRDVSSHPLSCSYIHLWTSDITLLVVLRNSMRIPHSVRRLCHPARTQYTISMKLALSDLACVVYILSSVGSDFRLWRFGQKVMGKWQFFWHVCAGWGMVWWEELLLLRGIENKWQKVSPRVCAVRYVSYQVGIRWVENLYSMLDWSDWSCTKNKSRQLEYNHPESALLATEDSMENPRVECKVSSVSVFTVFTGLLRLRIKGARHSALSLHGRDSQTCFF